MCRVKAGKQSRHFAGSSEQHGGFQLDDAVVAGFIDIGIVHVAELHHFARRNEVDRIGHHGDNVAVAGAHHQLEGAGIEEIAD